ncbi:MAG TPA: hypothetical protein PLD20_08080 [Blastocatellia bacterium]|nr:hypothetical protein [Blastocatellia bacterium]HMV85040.1 hypothetical protein [Blastocatellia bacterium]HMZ17871.1 hypothetical protein [Blastocatellia bacterium]HNG30918.1 hypothetical protein [Blastocatellia bacterium]
MISLLCPLLLADTVAYAQLAGESLIGTVTDSNGTAVAKNKVSATEVSVGVFKLNNSTFAAKYGRTSGGIESFVTESGGIQFHGSVCEFNISSALNAVFWAGSAGSTAADPVARRTPFHVNSYDAVIGGF